ncbi:UDP-2,4-diacetamido-2,4,6-trideoxy-beta-L-altropyranose hydrolase [Dongia soli]|uniref:UDP-2,4-diacetamido-2,4, 6-trideoxy-beta-L-altropyranose hydrolase n=1 Tax=Dongia soli TaxID=600628 RepID=A0ABU5EBH3_9PROT|nr:UDP-2,4-diacetamido-2,4,6-trideoxy-beta-L-altropyranose hydrolase [Dongia soli]MDY0883191.1 UDP-2,4-diacetamido-2,4,6-trideoxy-beta-L-altropyranose hydrolase [Dongia soli]
MTTQDTRLRTAVIIQARNGSTRLPGKVLGALGGRTVLEHVLTRCRAIHGVDTVVCATTDKASDDPVAAEATRLGFEVFRGDESDVLSRYLGAARHVDADIIMRVTADCPLIDPAICAAVLRLRHETDADYASNNMPRSFPHGLDCEAFTRVALEEAARVTTDVYDREHVTPWLRRHPSLTRANLTGPGWPATSYRWTLDYPDDQAFLSAVFNQATEAQLADMQSVLSLLSEHPDFSRLNTKRTVTSPVGDRPVAIFRFDADRRIGIGHAMRCATLSSRLEEFGWRSYWAIQPETATFLGSRLPEGMGIVVPAAGPAEQIAAIEAAAGHAELLVLDHYDLTAAFATAARQIVSRIVTIDDFADRPLDADLVVNSTPGITADRYDTLLRRPAPVLIGGMAAPLREQFALARSTILQQRPTGSIHRVLISFGGVDSLNATPLALNIVAKCLPDAIIDVVLGGNAPHIEEVALQVQCLAKTGRQIQLLRDVADMAGLMVQADLCIGAPGTTTWERGCLAKPSILIGIAENQRRNAEIVAQSGAGIICGFLTTNGREEVSQRIQDALSGIIAEPNRLFAMSEQARTLCDGRGVDRILLGSLAAETLSDEAHLSLRLAEATDEEMLLEWQAAPETRRYALNPAVPSAAEHHAWFSAKRAAAKDLLVVACIGGDAVGFIRLDWRGDNRGSAIYLISIAAAPGQYRRGIGRGMLQMIRRLMPGATFMAQVARGNTASIALFTGLGYRLQSDGYYWSVPE